MCENLEYELSKNDCGSVGTRRNIGIRHICNSLLCHDISVLVFGLNELGDEVGSAIRRLDMVSDLVECKLNNGIFAQLAPNRILYSKIHVDPRYLAHLYGKTDVIIQSFARSVLNAVPDQYT